MGLAAGGDDRRCVLVGRSRELLGLQTISAILEAGIDAVQTLDGRTYEGAGFFVYLQEKRWTEGYM